METIGALFEGYYPSAWPWKICACAHAQSTRLHHPTTPSKGGAGNRAEPPTTADDTLNKLVLTSALIFVSPGNVGQVVCGMVVSFVSLHLYASVQPHAVRPVRRIGYLNQMVVFVFFVLALCLKLQARKNIARARMIFCCRSITHPDPPSGRRLCDWTQSPALRAAGPGRVGL